MTEEAMTNDDTLADVAISNWTLATGTKPGAREVYSPRAEGTERQTASEAKAAERLRA